MSRLSYWKECLMISFEENGILFTDHQIDNIAHDVMISHENYGMAFQVPENPLIHELKILKEELDAEKNKVICSDCSGTGVIKTYGPCHTAVSSCGACHGSGMRKC